MTLTELMAIVRARDDRVEQAGGCDRDGDHVVAERPDQVLANGAER